LISTPTVFVLGAGASQSFNFPIGIQLCEQVITSLYGNGAERLRDLTGFDLTAIETFRDELLFSGSNSVDAFLENRAEFLDRELEKIPIVHLHGRLGFLPWQVGQETRPYDPTMNEAVLKACIKNIKVVHEDTAERDTEFKQAKKLLFEAERIYFLGFGFGQTNVQRLDLANLPTKKALIGSAFRWSETEMNNVRRLTAWKIQLISNDDCYRFVSGRVEWD
jgi:hypothetical protein